MEKVYRLFTIQGKICGNGNYGLKVLEGIAVVRLPVGSRVYPLLQGPHGDVYPVKVSFEDEVESQDPPTLILGAAYENGKCFVPKDISGSNFSMKNIIIALDIEVPPRWRMIRPWAIDLETVDGPTANNPWCIRTSPIGSTSVYRFDSLEPNDIIALRVSRGSKLDQILFVWKDGNELTGPEDGSSLRYIQDLLSKN